ncbi:MAG: hypothetical protein IH969_00480 [Candidatus Krumholzibacteriota bacterium]|nr:hypothetical protein [Candidatus Krumholzibacteriota bacterium]
MRHFLRVVFIALVLISVIPYVSIAQVPPVRERLGGRIGYVDTYGAVHEHYGGGWNANIYFTENLYKALFLDIRIGSIYLGDLLRPEVVEPIFGVSESEMRILFLSVGPQFAVPFGESLTGYAGASVGIYSTSVLFTSSFQTGDFSEQSLGGNASMGLLLRFTATWNLDFNLTVHHFRSDGRTSDLFYFFTGSGAEDPVFTQWAIGVAIDLR